MNGTSKKRGINLGLGLRRAIVLNEVDRPCRLGGDALLEPLNDLDRLTSKVGEACSSGREEVGQDRIDLDELCLEVIERAPRRLVLVRTFPRDLERDTRTTKR